MAPRKGSAKKTRYFLRCGVYGSCAISPLMKLTPTIIAVLAMTPVFVSSHPSQEHSATRTSGESLPPPDVTISEQGSKRIIKSNGIPNHPTGEFPNPGNPNAIAPQHYEFRMPLKPRENARFTEVDRQPVGVANNGVVFDPGTAEYWKNDPRSGWRMEAIGGARNLGLDQNNAHVQPNGAYHYHGVPAPLAPPDSETMRLLGWAADGFPIYGPMAHDKADDASSSLREMKPSYRLKSGERPGGSRGPGGKYDGTYTQDFEYVSGLGDLDEANGRRGVTPEYTKGTYYYVATESFPFLPRMLKGTPDTSFSRRGPGGMMMDRQNGGMRPGPQGGPGQIPPPPPPPGMRPPGGR